MNTPNLDALRVAREAAYGRTHCHCRVTTKFGEKNRLEHLKEFGMLCKKLTANGVWRRQWQCQQCFAHMPGDGINAGPPTCDLPDFLDYDDPVRATRAAEWRAKWESEKRMLPEKRAAWFADHDLYLKTPEWRRLRMKVLFRDGNRCTKCGANAAHVHHLTYERWQHEDLADLTSLCVQCHDKEHES